MFARQMLFQVGGRATLIRQLSSAGIAFRRRVTQFLKIQPYHASFFRLSTITVTRTRLRHIAFVHRMSSTDTGILGYSDYSSLITEWLLGQ